MNTYTCTCSQMLFFENTQCLACGREVGWCPECQAITPLDPQPKGGDACAVCHTALVKCHNYAVEHVCNRCVRASDVPPPMPPAKAKAVPAAPAPAAPPIPEPVPTPLCDYCRFNETIPNLNVHGYRKKWYRLEQGKRRLLYTLDLIGLPYGTKDDGFEPPLSFDFLSDKTAAAMEWQPLPDRQQIYTGHANGKITINLREADPAQREKLRVAFGEKHRTIIGHFRHEIAHYYWDVVVKGQCEDACIQVFGDHNNPTYADALKQYYEHGPPADWATHFISAYATMHPWEDFAETFGSYLDAIGALDTAYHLKLGTGVDPRTADFDALLQRYKLIGLTLNEMNREMGLKDLVPEVFVPPVVVKMRWIHDLLRRSATQQPAVAV